MPKYALPIPIAETKVSEDGSRPARMNETSKDVIRSKNTRAPRMPLRKMSQKMCITVAFVAEVEDWFGEEVVVDSPTG